MRATLAIWRSSALGMTAHSKEGLLTSLYSFMFWVSAWISSRRRSSSIAAAASSDAGSLIPSSSWQYSMFSYSAPFKVPYVGRTHGRIANIPSNIWWRFCRPTALPTGGQSTSLSVHQSRLCVWIVQLKSVYFLIRLIHEWLHCTRLRWSSR